MSRVSQEELYNDKDVVTQILKLKDTVNDYAGGIIENIDVSGNDLVIDWADGTSISLPLPDPVTGISSVTGNVSGGNLTITFYFTNGTTHSFTCPLAGMATEAYVDGLDAQNVKLTGAQTVEGVKTFSDSPIVPDAPATEHSAVNQDWAENVAYTDDTVNNLVHKESNETISGVKTFLSQMKFETLYPSVVMGSSNLGQYVNFLVLTKDITDADTSKRVMRMQARALATSSSINIGANSPNTNQFSDFSVVSNDNNEQYGTIANRISNAGQVSGVTTYDNDIVTIKTLKNLGLI